MSGVTHLVQTGPLILAAPIAAAAGAITFLSPCCLPLVPGYLSYVTGMSGTDAQRTAARPAGGRTMLGTLLFVLGFSLVFATEGLAFGSLGLVLQRHSAGLTQVLGALTIVLGLLFAGVFDRFPITGRIARPSFRPRAGLAGAPLLGVLFALSWTPCIGPTLSVVLTMSFTSGTAVRGAVLAFIYGLGLGIPFLIVAFAFQRGMTAFGWARRHAKLITRIGGGLLVLVGVLEVTGAWTAALTWLKVHWIGSYQAPL
jgi:cytochrome c-type biogenesis protein